MKPKTMALWLFAVIIGIGFCGTAVLFYVIPSLASSVCREFPQFAGAFWPWMIFLWISALPCYAVLCCGGAIAAAIGKENAFSHQNARRLLTIAHLAAADTVFFFAGNVVLFLLSMSHPSVFLAAMGICFAGICVIIVARTLAYFTQKAAVLHEDAALTI